MKHACNRRAISGVLALLGLAGGAIASPVRSEERISRPLVAQFAPSGTLRVAINAGNVVLAKRGGAQGASGVSVDIANALAERLDLPVSLLIYDSAGVVVDRLKDDRWDIAFMGIDPARSAEIAFTAPYVIIEGTYMVRDSSSFGRVADLDRAGVRIAVGRGTAYDLYLSRAIRKATLVRFDTSAAAISGFEKDGLEAVAGIREALIEAQGERAGYNVLPDSFHRIEQALAVPKTRSAALRYAAKLIEELKADGFIRAALDRHGQTRAQVAPPHPVPASH